MKKIRLILSVLLILAQMFCAVSCTFVGGDNETSGTADTSDGTTTDGTSDGSSGDDTSADVPAPDLSGMDLTPYISLDYKGLTLEVKELPSAVTDADVEEELRGIIVYYEKYTLDTSDRVTSEGDYIIMDYEGFMDGEAGENMKDEGASILLEEGKSGFIAGFASGLIGVRVGETVKLDLTFPEDYYEEIAGKPVTFNVTVKGICKIELTDTIASELSEGEYTTAAAYRAHLKEYLEELQRINLFNEVYQQIWDKLADRAEIKGYPENLCDYYYQSYVSQIIQMSEQYSMSYDEIMNTYGYTDDTLREYAKADADNELILYYIAGSENITMTEEQYKAYLNEIVESYKQQGMAVTAEEIEEYYGADVLRKNALSEKVTDAVFGYAEIVKAEAAPETTESAAADTAAVPEESAAAA